MMDKINDRPMYVREFCNCCGKEKFREYVGKDIDGNPCFDGDSFTTVTACARTNGILDDIVRFDCCPECYSKFVKNNFTDLKEKIRFYPKSGGTKDNG